MTDHCVVDIRPAQKRNPSHGLQLPRQKLCSHIAKIFGGLGVIIRAAEVFPVTVIGE
jgi:hypothetical protein